MPNRKYKCPSEGQLVAVKKDFYLCSTNAMTSIGHRVFKTYGTAGLKPVQPKVGTILMFLGIHSFDEMNPAATNRFVYKFLVDDKIVFTEPSWEVPKNWLSKHVRPINGNKA